MSQLTEQDLASSAFKANPYPTFARLRADDPVYLINSCEGERTWLITRYKDGEMVLRDERFVKNNQNTLPVEEQGVPEEQAAVSSIMADLFLPSMGKCDPPDHTRLRSLVNLSFTPRLVEQWRERIQEITDELIDAVQDRGSMDLLEEFAFPLPIKVISEMLGVPDEDGPELHRLLRRIVDALPVPHKAAPAELQACHRYLLNLIDSKRRAPADDLVSRLIQAEADGDRLSERELLANVFLLIMAGYQTTGSLIGNGIFALLTHPEQMAMLRCKPALIKTAVEEFLRYYSPLMFATLCWAREDVELGGTLIRRGDMVDISLASANHDCEIFADAERLDITRAENHHLAFSKGTHYCLGASLARLEGQIAINTLLRRLPGLRLQVDLESLTWRPGSMVLGLTHLPVAF